jgi:SAM-dependent methyltransferase
MQADATHLKKFYTTRLGSLAARLITARIHEIWGNLDGLSVLGLGHAAPFLTPLLGKPSAPRGHAERVIVLMPAQQGVMAWPLPATHHILQGRPCGNLSGLVDELQLPLADASFERIILAHILENTEQTRALLREVWRVLTPGGRLIVIVPNRSGLWAPFERTPFGTGRPYSRPQLSDTLAGSMLTPLAWRYALHLPPIDTRAGRKLLSALEYPGQRWFRRLAGVIVMEAEKQIYALTPEVSGTRKLRRRAATRVSHQGRNSSRSPS